LDRKPGRTDPCPCGSGSKYKNCCGRLQPGSIPEVQSLIALMHAGRFPELEAALAEIPDDERFGVMADPNGDPAELDPNGDPTNGGKEADPTSPTARETGNPPRARAANDREAVAADFGL